MGAMSRRLRALERRVGGSREFRAGAPPVDEDGLPRWDDSEPLGVDGYMKAVDLDLPDEALTEAEAEARARLAPYASVFEQLARDENEEAGP